jgi:hypothetical protein
VRCTEFKWEWRGNEGEDNERLLIGFPRHFSHHPSTSYGKAALLTAKAF